MWSRLHHWIVFLVLTGSSGEMNRFWEGSMEKIIILDLSMSMTDLIKNWWKQPKLLTNGFSMFIQVMYCHSTRCQRHRMQELRQVPGGSRTKKNCYSFNYHITL